MTIVIGIELLLLAAQSSRVSKTRHAKQRGLWCPSAVRCTA
jgi:hypothetical protein